MVWAGLGWAGLAVIVWAGMLVLVWAGLAAVLEVKRNVMVVRDFRRRRHVRGT